MTVELWTDGSGTVRGEPGGWAFILRARKDDAWVEKVDCGPASATSNNRMELTALIMGLRALARPCTVDLFSDSEYVVNAIKKGWIAKWVAKDWRKVKNDDLWRELVPLLEIHAVRANWIRGHNGTELNERCDELAGAMRAAALAAREEFMPEPAGLGIVQQSLLDLEVSDHLDSLASP